ncbi:MAG: DUF4433 domain-containing protein [Defluviitaleaceae bacterium]|nr:DUF4433 domain-containing protein [Defluviitaleaceae bacterium]
MSAFDVLKARGVSRLCHFTKFQSLTHIIPSADGILASGSIRSDTKNVIDTERYDGELDHVCCSIEYPNSWFLKDAIQKNTDVIFRDWVVLYIELGILRKRDTKFCPCNASTGRGMYITDDINALFENPVRCKRVFHRSANMLSCCPTDGQAEILIKDNIPRDYIVGITVGNEDVARRIYAMFKTYGVKQVPIFIAPDVLTPSWSNMIKNGRRPIETMCVWPEEE